MKIAINGFGRIGRSVFRILNNRDNIDVVAINDIFDKDALTYLLKYDTVMGRFPEEVTLNGDILKTQSQSVKLVAERDPSSLPWNELGVDIVIESTGIFRQRDQLQYHINAGAKRVVLTVPSKDEIDYTVVLGVNDDGLRPEHKIVSNASCTTNCLAPIVSIIHKNFEILKGQITTIHNPTNTNVLLDKPHKDLRRARSSMLSMHPTSTGSAKAIGLIFPELNGKLDGHAVRVPVINSSLTDCVFQLNKNCKASEVNNLFKRAAEQELKGILGIEFNPLVSIDFVNDTRSSIVDAPSTLVTDSNLLKIYSWYDNETGYACRMSDIAKMVYNSLNV